MTRHTARTLLLVAGIALPGYLTLASRAWADDAPPVVVNADGPDAPDADAPPKHDAQKPHDQPGEHPLTDRMRQRRQNLLRDGDGPPGPGMHPDRPGGPMQGPPDGPRPPAPLSADQQKQALEVLAAINPDLADRIADTRKTDPDRAGRILQRFGPRLLQLAEMKKSDPDLYKLTVADQRCNFETYRLVRQLRQAQAANETDRGEKLTAKLRELLDKHFDIRTKLREHELAMLEKRIDDLRGELKDHHDRKPQLIDEEIQRLTNNQPPRNRNQAEDESKKQDE